MEKDKIIDCKKEHLKMIQNIIIRMNSNSFTLKGMVVLIVTACFGIYTANTNINAIILLLPIIPIIIVCLLDMYYLLLERKFRYLYDDVILDIQNETNKIKLYDMSLKKYVKKNYKKLSFFNVFCSNSIWLFYVLFMILSIAIYFVVYFTKGV